MKFVLAIVAFIVCLLSVSAFQNAVRPVSSASSRIAPLMSTVQAEVSIKAVESPDFYWKYRLDRLVSKKGGEFAFNAKNYPEADGYKALYDSYYLDLCLQGKLKGFNWTEDKKISDGEWFSIYKSITEWTQDVSKKQKANSNNVPENDFDLLKQFYPELNYRDLETNFVPTEVGPNFPYNNLKELFGAAANGKLSISAPSGTPNLEATETRKKLAALKETAIKRVDAAYAKVMKYAEQTLPDEEAKKHYQTMKKKLADNPQGASAWAAQRANLEKDIDEMARFAARRVDEHHHHEGEGEHLSPAEEFEKKYGMNLDQLQETFNRFKADPNAFLETSIMSKFGRNGVDIWNKSQEFAAKYKALSPAERAAAETKYIEFLNQA